MTLDPKALEAAVEWFDANFNGLPDSPALASGLISSYHAALPQAEPVGFRWRMPDAPHWSSVHDMVLLPSLPPDDGRIIEYLFASTPAVSREDVIKECASAAAKFVPLRIRTDADRFQSKLAGDICCAIRALSSEPHHG